MDNELAPLPQAEVRNLTQRLTPAQLKADYNLVLQVMQSCMQKDQDYGIIPGTPKSTLYKPGAEKLGMVFHLAGKPMIEDLGDSDQIRYRVSTEIIHAPSGTVVAYGVGEASSNELKYKWRKAYKAEWEDTPEDRRRKKYGEKDGKEYSILQVRTEPADIANTILKMADKRSYISGILKATAASSVFSQDLEDMDEAMREAVTQAPEGTMPPIRTPGRKSDAKPEANAPPAAAAPASQSAPTVQEGPAPKKATADMVAMNSKVNGGSCNSCGARIDQGEPIWFDRKARRAYCKGHFVA